MQLFTEIISFIYKDTAPYKDHMITVMVQNPMVNKKEVAGNAGHSGSGVIFRPENNYPAIINSSYAGTALRN